MSKFTKAKFIQTLTAIDKLVVEKEQMSQWDLAVCSYKARLEMFAKTGWEVDDERVEDALKGAFGDDTNKKSLYRKMIKTSSEAEQIIIGGKALWEEATRIGLGGYGPDKSIRRAQTAVVAGEAPTPAWAKALAEQTKLEKDNPKEVDFPKAIKAMRKSSLTAAKKVATEKSIAEFTGALDAALALLVSKAPARVTSTPAKPVTEQVNDMDGDQLKELLAAVMAKLN